MNPKSGGPSSDYANSDSSYARQRQTAAEIARQKVLASYGSKNSSKTGPATAQNGQITIDQKPSNYKSAPNTIRKDDWKKYHTAWQGYYQKYYSDYYAKAAREYIAQEKLKSARKQQDQARATAPAPQKPQTQTPQDPNQPIYTQPTLEAKQAVEETLRDKIRAKASDAAKKSRKSKHFMPLLAGAAVVLLILFLQYNRLIFAPLMAYVSPGNTTDDGITALDATVTTAVSADPKLIIPKLNVDVPIHFGISNDTATVMDAMNNGVAQFSIPGASAYPGQAGNLVITGHSAGDIYSNNQYKFIFSGLERLQAGDTIYINYESKRYTYSVTELQTVEPSDVNALVQGTSKPMLTLVTCTPLGTSRYRLLVFADQVDPSPDTATPVESTDDGLTADPDAELPSNSPSFLEKLWKWLTNQD